MIPYTRLYFFSCKPKEDELLIEQLVKVEAVTLCKKGMVSILQALGRKDFFNHPREHYTPAQDEENSLLWPADAL